MKQWLVFAVALAIISADQFRKFLVRDYFSFTTNTGAAFGILQGQRWFLIGVALVVAVVLCVAIVKYGYTELGFILGGTIGNLIDRLVLGEVVDFIAVGWWPSFNVADSFNTIGVALLVFGMLGSKVAGVAAHPNDVWFIVSQAAGGLWLLGLAGVIVLAASMGHTDGNIQATGAQYTALQVNRDETARQVQRIKRLQGEGGATVSDLDRASTAASELQERIRAIKLENIKEINIASPKTIEGRFLEKNKTLKPRHRIFGGCKCYHKRGVHKQQKYRQT